MNLDPLAATYAQALLEAAAEKGLLEDVLEEVSYLAGRVREDRDLRLFLVNPRLEKASKRRALDSALRGRFSDIFLNFLLLVVDKGREMWLADMLEAYRALYDKKAGIVRAEALSAVPMSDAALDDLKNTMSGKLRKRVTVANKVDPDILGGLVVRYDGMVADGSLRTALEEIRTSMKSLKFGSEFVHEDKS